jgi:hypothetical protein
MSGGWTIGLARLVGVVLAALVAGHATAAPRDLKPVDHPLPPPRPADLGGPAPSEPYGPPIPPELLAAAAPDPEAAGCRERLEKLGVRFEARPRIADGACGAAEPVRVTALSPSLALSAPSTMVCPVAEALARWAAEAVEPAAREHLDDRPKRLAIGTGYECRGQRDGQGAKLSEHAFANAVDIMGFEFEKRPAIPVAPHPDGSPPDRFQDAVQARACAFFTTVLGPGSDAAHADHLHLDLRQRKRGATLCQ